MKCSLVQSQISELPYISINFENSNIYVLRTLDYEKVRDFQIAVRVADGSYEVQEELKSSTELL